MGNARPEAAGSAGGAGLKQAQADFPGRLVERIVETRESQKGASWPCRQRLGGGEMNAVIAAQPISRAKLSRAANEALLDLDDLPLHLGERFLSSAEIEAIEPVERTARALQIPELASPSAGGSEAL